MREIYVFAVILITFRSSLAHLDLPLPYQEQHDAEGLDNHLLSGGKHHPNKIQHFGTHHEVISPLTPAPEVKSKSASLDVASKSAHQAETSNHVHDGTIVHPSPLNSIIHNLAGPTTPTISVTTESPRKPIPHRDVCPDEALCVPPVQCPAHVRRIEDKINCTTIGGRIGVCCTTGQNHTENFHEKGRHHHMIALDHLTLGGLSRHSQAEMAMLRTKEARLLMSKEPTVLTPGTAAYGHFRNSRMLASDLSEVVNVAARALEIAIATRAFKDRQGLTNQQLEDGLIQQDLRPSPMGGACPPRPFCPPMPDHYRRIDGTCNNHFHTAWGAPFTPYARLLAPSYNDGIWAPRISKVNGQPLPSARLVSTTVFHDRDVPSPDRTLLLMQFGQFLSHEITQSLDTSFSNGSSISCCDEDGKKKLDPHLTHHSCMPIEIPKDDHFFGTFEQGCMNFVRSVIAPRPECTLGFAQQMNKVTHFIDGSSIYGSTPEQTGELRTFEQGQLEVFSDFGRDLLPLSKDPDACLTMEQGSACFTSGDSRTNQMVSLVAIHTLFMREHNRIAKILAQINPHWHDERIFLETRKIVTAELQDVVYKEFVPAVIGEEAMHEFQLNLRDGNNYAFDYDPSVEPSVINEFGSAAFRFGHSTVDGIMKLYGPNKVEEVVAIPEIMFHPARMRHRHFFDELLSTLTTEPMQEVDNCMPDALTKYLFRAGNPFGVDLAALNIQRGRDHGLRPYNDYRELVGLPRITSFEEFGPELSKRFSAVYASVDDIDLWVGGLVEPKAPGSVVGHTFRDIIADQFSRLKKGDRYFFENDPSTNPSFFTPNQLQEIRKVSMSKIICDNSDGILLARQAPNAFKTMSPTNEFMDCTQIPGIDFSVWQQHH